MPPPMIRRMRLPSKVMGPPGIDDRDLALLKIPIPRRDRHAPRFRNSRDLDIEVTDNDPFFSLARYDRAEGSRRDFVEQEYSAGESLGKHALGRSSNVILPPPVGQDLDPAHDLGDGEDGGVERV